MKTSRNKKLFTLLEVVIALAVLTMGIMGAMSISAMSKRRMDKAYESFYNQHILAQAAEYFLLCGSRAIEPEFFPFQGYSASCVISDCADIREAPASTGSEWRLATYTISVRGNNAQITNQIKVDKIVKNDMFR